MTLCNMAIEAGARAGLIAPDQTTFDYLEGREFAPKAEHWDAAVSYWKSIASDDGASFDETIVLKAEDIAPQVSWGTSPEQVVAVDAVVPAPSDFDNEVKALACESALKYMDIKAGQKITDIHIDIVFVGSCTNGRIEDFRAAAKLIEGKKVASGVQAIAVPGSFLVKEQAEAEGLDKIFIDAGWEWRDPHLVSPAMAAAASIAGHFVDIRDWK